MEALETSLEALETSSEVAAVETSSEVLETSLEVAAVETSLEVAAVVALHNHCPEHYNDLEIE